MPRLTATNDFGLSSTPPPLSSCVPSTSPLRLLYSFRATSLSLPLFPSPPLSLISLFISIAILLAGVICSLCISVPELTLRRHFLYLTLSFCIHLTSLSLQHLCLAPSFLFSAYLRTISTRHPSHSHTYNIQPGEKSEVPFYYIEMVQE